MAELPIQVGVAFAFGVGARSIGLPGVNWLFDPNVAKPAFILMSLWTIGPQMVIFLAGMQTISDDLYEAAKIDGASGWSLFSSITWPQLTPAINTNFLLNIIGSLQAWSLFYVLTGYKNGTQVLGYVVFIYFFQTRFPRGPVEEFLKGVL